MQLSVYNTMVHAISAVQSNLHDPNAKLTVYNPRYYPVAKVRGAFSGRPVSDVVKIEFVLDETISTPPLDINGDGDTIDNQVSIDEVRNVVFVKVTARWQNHSGTRIENAQTSAILWRRPRP